MATRISGKITGTVIHFSPLVAAVLSPPEIWGLMPKRGVALTNASFAGWARAVWKKAKENTAIVTDHQNDRKDAIGDSLIIQVNFNFL